MSIVFIQIFEVFRKRKLFFFTLLGIATLISCYSISSLSIDSNIYSVLPKSSEFEKFSSVTKDNINKEILFATDIEGLNANEIQGRLTLVSSLIRASSEEFIVKTEFDFSDKEKEFANHFLDNLYYFLDEKDYQNIDSILDESIIASRIAASAAQLSSINSLFSKEYILKDPLGIGLNKLKGNVKSEFSPISNQDGILINVESNSAIIRGTLRDQLTKVEKFKIERQLVDVQSQLAEDGIHFDFFNSLIYENANANTIKKDTKITLTITVFLLIVLLLYFYRNIGVSIFFVISVVLSSIFGLGLTSIFRDQLSGLAIAASSVLLGIVVDYTFHVITHFSKTNDLRNTIETITQPLLIGSFTTVVAFASLMQLESSILNDFGLLALCTLSSSALVNLGVLPIVIETLNLRIKNNESKLGFDIPSVIKKLVFSATVFSIILCAFYPPTPLFDNDIRNLGYFPKELTDREYKVTGITPDVHKSLILFIEDQSLENSIDKTRELYDYIKERKGKGIAQITSPSDFILTQTQSRIKADRWNDFWKERSTTVRNIINSEASLLGFNNGVFSDFTNKINGVKAQDELSLEMFKNLGLDKMITQTKDGYRVATSLVIVEDSLESIKSELPQIEGLFVFDTSEIASSVLNSVSGDFNYLLIFTSLLVFLSLIFLYGHIELALFSFFPMALIWIWVLYISQTFNISFNFVNVLLATIIFGLGDDYSIFVTDGLLNKYKGNKSLIKTFNTAIVLSAVTTIIGTGVLFFANHPSVKSIAAMSVIGMTSILIVTLIVQPIIFDAFILDRVKNKKTPITLFGLIVTVLTFSIFAIGCVLLSLLACVLFFIPIPMKSKRKLLNFLICNLTRLILLISIHIKKEKGEVKKIDFNTPSILISNHTSFVDIIVALSLSPKIVLVAKEWVSKIPFMGLVFKYSGHICTEYGGEKMLEEMKRRIDEGYSILFFPEGTRSYDGELLRFHKGAFHASKRLGADIQPILINGCEHISPKGDFMIKNGKIIVHVLNRISINDAVFKNRLGIVAQEFKSMMKSQQKKHRIVDYDMKYMMNRISYNYIYKGNELEWYFKVKWPLESATYSKCNKIIGDRKRIYDLGGGYGYFSFFLHYFDRTRRITSVDYDENKTNIASNSAFKTDNLEFIQGEIENVDIDNYDACILYDVLHYLPKDKRRELFKKLSLKINSDGVIIVREGLTNFKASHKKTKLTELFSTKILKFNKVVNKLNFMSIEEIEELSKEFKLSYELLSEYKTMSNILIVFKRAD